MSLSVLLRLVPNALIEGRVAGHAEIVDSGETAFFKDLEEMVAFLQAAEPRDIKTRGDHDGMDPDDSRPSNGPNDA